MLMLRFGNWNGEWRYPSISISLSSIPAIGRTETNILGNDYIHLLTHAIEELREAMNLISAICDQVREPFHYQLLNSDWRITSSSNLDLVVLFQ